MLSRTLELPNPHGNADIVHLDGYPNSTQLSRAEIGERDTLNFIITAISASHVVEYLPYYVDSFKSLPASPHNIEHRATPHTVSDIASDTPATTQHHATPSTTMTRPHTNAAALTYDGSRSSRDTRAAIAQHLLSAAKSDKFAVKID